MGSYFLDTSALVKRYIAEVGHEWVEAIYTPDAEHTIIISQAALVEAVATFCHKARDPNVDQRISEADRNQAIAVFRRDARRQYNVVPVTTTLYTRAGNLCLHHRLRAYDAVQLACALTTRDKLAALGVAPVFVSADLMLLDIAAAEGLTIANPNTQP